jgi:hypothetical protein
MNSVCNSSGTLLHCIPTETLQKFKQPEVAFTSAGTATELVGVEAAKAQFVSPMHIYVSLSPFLCLCLGGVFF